MQSGLSLPEGGQIANITLPKWIRDFSPTNPNGFGTENTKNTTCKPFFLQEKSLLLERTFLWKSATDFEA